MAQNPGLYICSDALNLTTHGLTGASLSSHMCSGKGLQMCFDHEDHDNIEKHGHKVFCMIIFEGFLSQENH